MVLVNVIKENIFSYLKFCLVRLTFPILKFKEKFKPGGKFLFCEICFIVLHSRLLSRKWENKEQRKLKSYQVITAKLT